MSVSTLSGAPVAYRLYHYLYCQFNGQFVPVHQTMFFEEFDESSAGQKLDALGKDRMGPPVYYQPSAAPRNMHIQKKTGWAPKRSFRGLGPISPAPSESESDDSGNSNKTCNPPIMYDTNGVNCPYEVGPLRVHPSPYTPRFPNLEVAPPVHPDTIFFQNKRRFDGSRTSFRGHRPPPPAHYCPFPIAPDRYLMKSHLIQVRNSPRNLLIGSKWDTLSLEVWNRFMHFQQTEHTFKDKMTLWRFLYVSIKTRFPRYSLYLVGSTASGFGANSSDMDLCLLVRSKESVDCRSNALYHLDIMLDYIRSTNIFIHAELIKAKVPILKFRDTCFSIEIDLNCNNVVGIRNTHLLYCYSQLDWRVRPLVLIIKLWAQHNNINDPKNKTISSYSLVLMVLHYLQYGVSPPVLPCLQAEFPNKFDPDQDIHNIEMFDQMPAYISKNKQPLGELLHGFLEYYTNFKYSQYTISVRTGGCISVNECRASRQNEPHQWKLLCVEEPFDLSNTARSVYDPDVFTHILKVFEKSCRALDKCLSITALLPP